MFLLDIVFLVVAVGFTVPFFTGESALSQLDYIAAAFGGVLLIQLGIILFPILYYIAFMPATAGAFIGCALYHLYKETMGTV